MVLFRDAPGKSSIPCSIPIGEDGPIQEGGPPHSRPKEGPAMDQLPGLLLAFNYLLKYCSLKMLRKRIRIINVTSEVHLSFLTVLPVPVPVPNRVVARIMFDALSLSGLTNSANEFTNPIIVPLKGITLTG